MADQNEIGIDLRLRTSAQDIAKAGDQISKGISKTIFIEPTKKLDATIDAWLAKFPRWDKTKVGLNQGGKGEDIFKRRVSIKTPQFPQPPISESEIQRMTEQGAKNRAKAWEAFEKDSDRRKADAEGRRSKLLRVGQSLMAGVGLGVPGLGAIAGLAQLNPVAAVLAATFRIVTAEAKFVAREFHRAAEQARSQYSKSLTSGFGTSFTINRSLLAKTIGVSEDEVYQFGGAVGFLNQRLELASKTMAEANLTLTASAWNASILETDFEALRMKMAQDVAPAINILTVALDELVKMTIRNSETIIAGAAKFGLTLAIQNNPVLRYAAAVIGSAIDKNGGIGGAGQMQAPPPVAFMKQMKASQWERMGLVIGSGGGTNYGQKTAENTKATATLLASLPTDIAAAFTRYMSHNVNHSIPQIP